MWKKYRINELDPKDIDITEKRFNGQKTLLPELLDTEKFIVKEFFKPCLSPVAVINKVIAKIKYPLTSSGQPTDLHYFQAFRKWGWSCHKTFKNDYDFWQFASETIWLNMGDCEDSSILTGAGLELKQTSYFVVLGRVFKLEEGFYRLLGYHAWVICYIANAWRLVETTLDTPYSSPYEMTPVNIRDNEWRVGDILYEAMVMFNKQELWEWVNTLLENNLEEYYTGKILKEYMKKSKKEKESKKKYEELHKSYMKHLNKGSKVITWKKKKVM